MSEEQSYTKIITYDWNIDGIPDSIEQSSRLYNKNGLLIKESYNSDSNGDGTLDYVTTVDHTYEKGRLVKSVSTSDWDANGVLDRIYTVENTYKKDNLVNISETYDYDANGTTDAVTTQNITFNKKGQPTDYLYTYDWENDGNIDEVNSNHIGYDRQGRILWQQDDYLNDGFIDVATSYEYDSRKGLDHTKTTVGDYGQDGTPNYIDWSRYQYNKDEKVTYEEYRHDWNADGQWDHISVIEFGYKKGNMTSQVQQFDWEGDGIFDALYNTEWTYTNKGEIETTFQSYDWNMDGAPDSTYLLTNTFNKRGDVTFALYEYDHDGNGSTDQTDSVSYVYNGSRLAFEYHDSGNDGTVEMTVTYDPLVA